MNDRDSKALWHNIYKEAQNRSFALGPLIAGAYLSDPKILGFVASRYKFVSKMIPEAKTVLEIGCGDGFGAPVVAHGKDKLWCTDIEEASLEDNQKRYIEFPNIAFEYHDFREAKFHTTVDAAYCVDVIEHLYPEEEAAFLKNITKSLTQNGVFVVGTPNIEAKKYASKYSREGHVNLKSHETLNQVMREHFDFVFMFSMNDEVLHTGFNPMAHYVWAVCAGPRI